MYILRSVQREDLEDLFELSKLVRFINLPPDKDIISKKIESSMNSFDNPSDNKSKNYYIFVIQDISSGKVIGASMIHGQHGTDDEPHYFLKVGNERKYSDTISTGFIHGTLLLDYEPNGYSEIGGLVLHPDFRGLPGKLGKQLSFVRFLYIGTHKEEFTKKIHSELMPPLDRDGNSPLWEAIGRRFMNMDYHEADVLSRSNKEFIFSLFPSGIIYQTLLPVEARHSIGKVGQDTLPVKKMLEDIGFKYTMEVDPFDGGPHYRADKDEIKPIKNLMVGKVKYVDKIVEKDAKQVILSIPTKTGFKSISVTAVIENDRFLIVKDQERVIGSEKDDRYAIVM